MDLLSDANTLEKTIYKSYNALEFIAMYLIKKEKKIVDESKEVNLIIKEHFNEELNRESFLARMIVYRNLDYIQSLKINVFDHVESLRLTSIKNKKVIKNLVSLMMAICK